MSWGQQVPASVPMQMCHSQAPTEKRWAGRHRMGKGCMWPPPHTSDPVHPPPRGHLCDGFSAARPAKQSHLRSLRLSIAIAVIEIPFRR